MRSLIPCLAPLFPLVTPAKAGVQGDRTDLWLWISAYAGMTVGETALAEAR